MKVVLNETLTRLNKSQYWLSKETGIAASTINNLCNGKTSRIDFDVLDKICLALKCSVSDVFIAESEVQQRILEYALGTDSIRKAKDDTK